MPAFLSSDQINELKQKKAIIELDIYGFGIVTVDRNEKCEYCPTEGKVYLTKDITACMGCQRLNLSNSNSNYEDVEALKNILDHIPQMIDEAILSLKKRHNLKRRS